MSSLQSTNSSQHHQAAFNSLKINLKYCKFQINLNCVQMGRKSVLVRSSGKLLVWGGQKITKTFK